MGTFEDVSEDFFTGTRTLIDTRTLMPFLMPNYNQRQSTAGYIFIVVGEPA